MKHLSMALLAASLVAAPALADRGWFGAGDEPPGQVVSGCNHQANDLKLKGKERKRFVERCKERGGDRWSSADNDRNCRERAARLDLGDAAREDFMRHCREYRDDGPPDARRKQENESSAAKRGPDEPFNPRDTRNNRDRKDVD
jgi:hypothetical protein